MLRGLWNRDAGPVRLPEVVDEIRVPQQILDPIADITLGVETEQRCRGRIEPNDLEIRVQNNAGVADCAGRLSNLANQAMVAPLAIARAGFDAVRAGDDFGPQAARIEQRQAPGPENDAVEHEQISQSVGHVDGEPGDQPPGDAPDPQADCDTDAKPDAEADEMG